MQLAKLQLWNHRDASQSIIPTIQSTGLLHNVGISHMREVIFSAMCGVKAFNDCLGSPTPQLWFKPVKFREVFRVSLLSCSLSPKKAEY